MSRVVRERIDRVTDHGTGEITQESRTTVVDHGQEPPYVKLYLDDLCLLTDVSEGLKNVLFCMLRKLDYDGYVTLSPRYRRAICEELNIQNKTLRNRLSELVKKELFVKDGINEYIANPNYFARGKWREVVEQRKSFEMRVSYSAKGKTIKAVFTDKKEGDAHLQQNINLH